MKRVISLLLSIIMLFSITTGIDISAYAWDGGGSCGKGVNYKYETKREYWPGGSFYVVWNKLYIYGNGYMKNKPKFAKVPAKSVAVIIIDEGVKSIGDYAFDKCVNMTEVTIPNTVKKIGKHAFERCSKLKSLTIPDSVTEIGKQAFICCEDIKTLKLGKNVKTIEKEAFCDCRGISKITIPDSVETIGKYAFEMCYDLDEIKMGNNVKSIGAGAFSNCTFSKVRIPSSVKEMGGAFANSDVEEIYYEGTKEEWLEINSGYIGEEAFDEDGEYNSEKDGSINYARVHYQYGKNTLTVSQSCDAINIERKKLKKKNQSISFEQVATVKKAKGAVTYSKASGNKNITVNKNTGKITVKKGLKKGTYNVKIKVNAAGTKKYKKASKTISLKIIVGSVSLKLKEVKLDNDDNIKVKWEKMPDADGYQIECSGTKDFSDYNTERINIKDGKQTSKTIEDFWAGTNYFRIRSYTVKNGKKVYSAWSNTKSIKAGF